MKTLRSWIQINLVYLMLITTSHQLHTQTYVWAKTVTSYTSWGTYAFDIQVDNQGNSLVAGQYCSDTDFDHGSNTHTLAVAGTFTSTGPFGDAFVAKYDPNGNFLWVVGIGGSQDDVIRSVKVDAQGNVYVAGFFHDTVDFDPGNGTATVTTTAKALFVAKYSAGGSYLWSKTIHPSGGPSWAYEVSLDVSGNVLLSGTFGGVADFDPGPGSTTYTATQNDIFFAKYTSQGNFMWCKHLPGSGNDHATGIKVDAANCIYIGGYFSGTADFDPGPGNYTLSAVGGVDLCLAKYDSSGNFRWARSVGSNTTEGAWALDVDLNANIYLTGQYHGTADYDPGPSVKSLTCAGNADVFIVKFDSSANCLWAKGFGGPSIDIGYAIETDAAGNCYVTGEFDDQVDFNAGSGTAIHTGTLFSQTFLTKYSTSGNYQWAGMLNGNQVGWQTLNAPRGISIGSSGSIYLAGWFCENTDFDMGPANATHTAAHQPDGTQMYFAKYNDNSCSVNLSSSSNPICLGSSVTLSTNATSSISWNTGASTPSIIVTPTATTSYTVSGIATSGTTTCTGTQVIQVNVNPLPSVTAVGEKTQVCVNTSVSFTASGASSYLWNNNANTDTTSAFISTAGLHSMVVTGTDQNGCKNTATVTITAQICSDLPQHDLQGITVFPNPGHGLYTLRLHKNAAYTVKIFTCTGSLITEMVAETNEIPIDLSNNNSGIYFLQVYSSDKPSIALRIIKE